MLFSGILPYTFWSGSSTKINSKHINCMWRVPTIGRKALLPDEWQTPLFRFLVTQCKKKTPNQHVTDLNYNENNLFTMQFYLYEI